MRKIISNAFAASMLPKSEDGTRDWVVTFTSVNPSEVPSDVESAVGHADTANVLTGILGFQVKQNRVSIHLDEGDVLYVAQFEGSRLPEGATTLPEGATLSFLKVKICKNHCKECWQPWCECSGGTMDFLKQSK